MCCNVNVLILEESLILKVTVAVNMELLCQMTIACIATVVLRLTFAFQGIALKA